MELKLQNSDRLVVIDDGDYERVSSYSWYLVNDNQVTYAGVVMARLIMRPTLDQDVDHINGDGLDNRKVNLRCCSHQENCFNQRRQRGKSGFVGVTLHTTGRWRADISINYKTKYIGLFDSPEEAALARDTVARELHGEYAVLNFS